MLQRYTSAVVLPRLKPAVVIGVPFLAILVSEGLLFYDLVTYSLVGHLVTVAYCTIGIRLLPSDRDVLGAFVLIPIFRLVNLASPVITPLTLLWLPFVYGPFVPGLLWFVWRRPSYGIGLIGHPLNFLIFLPLTAGWVGFLAPLEYEFIRPEALIPIWQPQNVIVLSIVMIVFVALVEELIFRGILQGALVDRFGTLAGIVVASLVFGAVHAGYGSPDEIALAVLIGMTFGSIYELSDSIVLVILAHGLLNVMVFGFLPLNGSFVSFGF